MPIPPYFDAVGVDVTVTVTLKGRVADDVDVRLRAYGFFTPFACGAVHLLFFILNSRRGWLLCLTHLKNQASIEYFFLKFNVRDEYFSISAFNFVSDISRLFLSVL